VSAPAHELASGLLLGLTRAEGGQMDDQTDDGKQTEDALAECEERVEELEEENADLRNAAQTFGDLAERLNTKQRLDND
jgi:predicted RNase H-like nuclease (RuvC/YqgF family)